MKSRSLEILPLLGALLVWENAAAEVLLAQTVPTKPVTHALVLGKGRAIDPQKMQERAVTAVRKVAGSLEKWDRGMVMEALAEKVMMREQLRQGLVRPDVNGAFFEERLRKLAESAGPRDTVIIYTHSHGSQCLSGEPVSQGGLALDPGRGQPGSRGLFTWERYADLILEIPAKNVVVLAMSCFSGGLVETLNAPAFRERWNDRRRKHGRNLIVLTSQNAELQSPPIVKDRELINPFTYAVAGAFGGEADGFKLEEGKPDGKRSQDGQLTVGEMIDFILYVTENTVSDWAGRQNIAKPQLTGSFERGDVLFDRAVGK